MEMSSFSKIKGNATSTYMGNNKYHVKPIGSYIGNHDVETEKKFFYDAFLDFIEDTDTNSAKFLLRCSLYVEIKKSQNSLFSNSPEPFLFDYLVYSAVDKNVYEEEKDKHFFHVMDEVYSFLNYYDEDCD